MGKQRNKHARRQGKEQCQVLTRTATHFEIKAPEGARPVRGYEMDVPYHPTDPPPDLTPYWSSARPLPEGLVPPIFLTYHAEIDRDPHMDALFHDVSAFATAKQCPVLVAKLSDCNHKVHAVYYHLKAISKHITAEELWFAREYKGNGGFSKADPVLIYQTEALLFQIKSNLDLLTQVLSLVIPKLRIDSFRSEGKPFVAGGKVIRRLTEEGHADLANIFDTNRAAWIQQMVLWRDEITHHSKLQNFLCFVPSAYVGGDSMAIRYPTMPSTQDGQPFGERVDMYCQQTYNYLCQLYKDVLAHVVQRLL